MARAFGVPVLGVLQPPAGLGGHAELVVAVGHAWPVAEFLFDGEGFGVPVLGVIQPPPPIGDVA